MFLWAYGVCANTATSMSGVSLATAVQWYQYFRSVTADDLFY